MLMKNIDLEQLKSLKNEKKDTNIKTFLNTPQSKDIKSSLRLEPNIYINN